MSTYRPEMNVFDGEVPHEYRRHHSNNSLSSSSTVTLQRAASLSRSRSTSRHPTGLVPQRTPLDAPYSKPTSPEARRPSASHSRSNSVSGVRDGIGNLNRWSQSTASSKESPDKRSSTFSRRMSFSNIEQSPSRLRKARPSLGSPQYDSAQPVDGSAVQLPPIISLPSLQQAVNDSVAPLTTTATPPTAAVYPGAGGRDYFGSSWDGFASRGNSRARSDSVDPLRPVPATNSPPRHRAVDSRGHSRNRSQAEKSSGGTVSSTRSRRHGTKQPSQKAMLSKALQKANTAVLLDNAQNFEGAIGAYSEACELLAQVMSRSSGDDDKKKLEAIVSTEGRARTEG